MHHTLRLIALVIVVGLLGLPRALAAQETIPVASPAAGAAAPLLAVMDPSADPGEDFYRYATGGWQDGSEIPADRAVFGVLEEVDELTIEQLLSLLDRLAASDTLETGSDDWKAVQLFSQGIDLETRNAQGIEPIAGDLAAIDAISNLDELYAFLRDAPLGSNAWGLYGIYGDVDLADSSIYTAWYSGPYLGLPNRDYYWIDDEGSEEIREAYRAAIATMLGFVGYDEAAAADAAARVYEFEKRLAEPTLRPEDFNDPANYYHPRPVADLAAANPDFDWPAFLEIMGIPDQESIVISEPAYLEAVDAIVESTDLETIKDYLTLQVLWSTAPGLTREMSDAAFAFYGTALEGIEEQRPIEEQALLSVNSSLGFALGKLYVEEHFPPEAKAQIEQMVQRLIAATRTRIEALDWMAPETKEAALAKLDTMRVKVGYPERWRTYETVTIGDSYAASLLSANIADYKRQLARIGQPVDRDEWWMLPQEVNAYYSATNNEIVFPAAILQAPFFDFQADPAFNYGSIGATIGHEITHAYDQSGSQFDANGNFVEWWTPEDNARFDELAAAVVDQYDAIAVLPGLHVDGELTIGENIADMGGLQIAYDALQAELAEEGDPGLIEGLTQDQRFFLSYAYSWAEEARDAFRETQLLTDYHAPAPVRAVQPARNMDEFFAAFDIVPGAPMYFPPEKRIVIW